MECQPPAVENFFSRPKTKAHYLLRSRNNYGKFCHEETKYFARMRRLGAARLAYRGSIKCLRETEIEREREGRHRKYRDETIVYGPFAMIDRTTKINGEN